MMKKHYKNSQEITTELKKLRLKRDISVEEIKLIKEQLKEDLSIANWIRTLATNLGKLGAYNFAKNMMK
ncbi:hypothetical protein RRF68_12225 [Tenacibaculum sp. HL-MS23]|uniref:hypothetical protein n=1 Tax=Tenacibaculum sp. HL-MS23 TaxID=3077734 RepID=UPI0028FC3036|nr:hypothetical protein [Tenacibaculum sp. HL-MS23]WNW01725.1 hypothetical protein RRF68_12225 [Tenacibaculum sp. HL-MS23]